MKREALGTPCIECEEVLELEPLIVLDDVIVFWFDCERCKLAGPAVVRDDD